jgi:hypothetical protein
LSINLIRKYLAASREIVPTGGTFSFLRVQPVFGTAIVEQKRIFFGGA